MYIETIGRVVAEVSQFMCDLV
nr:unnamed protein product [Callosobruchus analis]CAI5860811.1 unnamed protein product [Callosobruchus analis]CAI5861083.1 unnamed protein product [Callosobruchus analis]